MASTSLRGVRATLLRNISDSRRVVTDAYRWSIASGGAKRPLISTSRRDAMTELAFLRAFLAWESFLEQSFTLYMLGRKPPGGTAPRGTLFPVARASVCVGRSRRSAIRDVDDPADIVLRAERFFHGGRPFAATLRAHQNMLYEARTLRNAIAHWSSSTQQKFESHPD